MIIDPLVRLEVSKEGIEGPLGLLAIYAFGSLTSIKGNWRAATATLIGFRNIAVHEYQALQLPITVHIIDRGVMDARLGL